MLIFFAACREEPVRPDVPADEHPTAPVEPTEPAGTSSSGPTWWGDVRPVVAERCATCHRAGDIGPFSLESWEEARPWADAMAAATASRAMPPWQPSGDCRPLVGDPSLSDDEIALFADWAAAGAPEGDPADATEVPEPLAFAGDLQLAPLEAYTPRPDTDDYRCFVVDWPLAERAFVTAYQVAPGARDLVHHVILYLADAADAADADAREAGPGYTCFGSAGVSATTLGAWVPGVSGVDLPPGTGVAVEPGSALVVQVHYNTVAAAPREDLTSIELALADAVDAPAAPVLYTDPLWLLGAMRIPAGDPDTELSTSVSKGTLELLAGGIGGSPADPLRLHRVALHMHTLGTATSLRLARADGSEECLLDIPDWDFHWQGGYNLVDPVVLEAGDRLELSCRWSNAAPGAVDVAWGEGTSDEMCLAGLYLTR